MSATVFCPLRTVISGEDISDLFQVVYLDGELWLISVVRIFIILCQVWITIWDLGKWSRLDCFPKWRTLRFCWLRGCATWKNNRVEFICRAPVYLLFDQSTKSTVKNTSVINWLTDQYVDSLISVSYWLDKLIVRPANKPCKVAIWSGARF